MSNGLPVIPGYETLEHLGTGGSGEVWVVRRPDGVRFAAKLVHAAGTTSLREPDLLQRLDHDHVVRLREVLREQDGERRQVLILDLAEGGSLADAIAARGTFTAGELVTVLTPIARTLHDLHGAGMVHADISTGNVLFTDAGKPLLADLGVSRVAGSYDEHTWATEAWAAPEVLVGTAAEPASDVWSLGSVAWACITGSPPPPSLDRPALRDVAPHMPTAVIDLVDAAMDFDAARRPSAGEFALRLWRCADAEPAPIAGSRGSRGRAAMEEPELLTRRMVRAAREAEQPGPVDTGRRSTTRLSLHAPGRRTLLPIAGASLALLAALTVWSTLRSEPTHAVGAIGAVSSPAVAATKPAAHPAADQVHVANNSANGSASIQTPSRIVSGLVAARARAWNQEDPRLLGYALAPNSPADQADRASLEAARRQGVDYQGLTFELGQTSVTQRSADRMTVVVSIRRSDYVATVATSVRSTPADSRRVTLHLVKVGDQWRIHSWT